MKSTKIVLGIVVVALGFASCKDEKTAQAEKIVDSYVMYVDSLVNVSSEDAKENWQGIEATYQLKSGAAKVALAKMKDNAEAQKYLNEANAKYEVLKAKYEDEIKSQDKDAAAANLKQQMRNALFGEGKVGEVMSFAWVDKNNILSVYQQFVDAVETNKDKYSREDWDEVKLMYEALDSRKNTVEKEGLSVDDNKKISGLKLKFAPMYTLNRMGAKSEEMKKAKE